MTVRRGDDGLIVLDGVCPVEDAEPLLQLLQIMPAAKVDWRQCGQLHTAVLQLVLASGRASIGPCGDAWIEQWLVPKLPQNEAGAEPGGRAGANGTSWADSHLPSHDKALDLS